MASIISKHGPGMRARGARLHVWAVFTVVLLLTACGGDPVKPLGATQVPAVGASGALGTLPAEMQPAVLGLAQAVQAQDVNALAPWLLEEVWLAAEYDQSALNHLPREVAVQWLGARWGTARQLGAASYSDHSGVLAVTTLGWAPIPPLARGEVSFHLHRYNAAGQLDENTGEWRVDGLLYR